MLCQQLGDSFSVLTMFHFILDIILICFCLKTSLSLPVENTSTWLPKCCGKGKQISSDGKSCFVDNTEYLKYSVDGSIVSFQDVLPITKDNVTTYHRLEAASPFTCVRPELYVVHDDLELSAEGDVTVWDDWGDPRSMTRDEMCVDVVTLPTTNQAERVWVALLCPSCSRQPCINKCCSETQQLRVSKDGSQVDCVPTLTASAASTHAWTSGFLQNTSDQPFIFHGFPECVNSLYLDFPEDGVTVDSDGHLSVGRERMRVPRHEYCADSSADGAAVVLLACRRLAPTDVAIKSALYGCLFLVGSALLALTLALHACLPELRKSLHSRVLVAHISCLLVSYLGLAVVNLAYLPAPSSLCSALAFIIQFSTLAAMFWLNIMCLDIAWTFSGLRAPKASQSLDSDAHKFLYYSLYAWGSTAALSAVTAVLEYSPLVAPESRLKPHFGLTRCWFQYEEAVLLLVYGPMGVLLAVNIALFVYTAYKIRQTQRDTASLAQHAHGSRLKENKDRFTLYLKLFCLMGVTWAFEIISWWVGGPDKYWFITDGINALRSVFIFSLFCAKKNVFALLMAKFNCKKKAMFPSNSRKSQSSSKTISSVTSRRTNSIQLSQIS